jgi:rSAM-associated Gly-rich repeat protein
MISTPRQRDTGQTGSVDYTYDQQLQPSSLFIETTIMSLVTRREYFKSLLNGLVQTAGTMVLASVVLPGMAAQAKTAGAADGSADDLRRRADQLADAQTECSEGEDSKSAEWVNGAFRNSSGGGGGFRNAGFVNGGGGGGFRNGGFVNGGWRN